MKYLKRYNESIRDLMTPKSEDEILKSLKKLSNSELLEKSIDNDFIKGIEFALQYEISNADILLIKDKIFDIKNKEIVRLLLDRIKDKLTGDQIYILEKYVFGLHQDEEKDYEKWFKEMLTDLEVSRSKQNNDILIYKKGNVVLYNYEEKNRWFYISCNKIWSVFRSKYHFNFEYNEIDLLTKCIVEEHLNLKDITTYPNFRTAYWWDN
jgi:hypothetical protein